MIANAASVAADQAAAIKKAEDAVLMQHVYAAFPTLVRCDSTSKMIAEDVRNIIPLDGGPPTLSWFEFLLTVEPEYFKKRAFAVTTEEERKRVLVAAIMKLLRENGPKQSEWTLANEQKRLSLPQVSVQELEAKLVDVQNRQRLAGMTVAQIQAEIRASKPQPPRVVLPQEYTVRRIKSMGVEELKTLIRTFGTNAVNDRLFSRS